MSCGFVIGNGESRKSIPLDRLKGRGPIYGCNGLYRDFSPDLLFARDRKMIEEVVSEYEGEKAIVRADGTIHLSSGSTVKIPTMFNLTGVISLFTMCYLNKVDTVYMLGFDSYKKYNDHLTNNVYKDTDNYKKSTESGKPLLSHSIRDVKWLLNFYPDKKFVCVNEDASPEWLACKNFELIGIKEFVSMVTNEQ